MSMAAAYKDQAKQSLDKNAWEEKPEENPLKTGKSGEKASTTGVATTTGHPWQPPRSVVVTTGWPWWPLPGGAGFLHALRFGAVCATPWAAGFAFPWGILGLFASFF